VKYISPTRKNICEACESLHPWCCNYLSTACLNFIREKPTPPGSKIFKGCLVLMMMMMTMMGFVLNLNWVFANSSLEFTLKRIWAHCQLSTTKSVVVVSCSRLLTNKNMFDYIQFQPNSEFFFFPVLQNCKVFNFYQGNHWTLNPEVLISHKLSYPWLQ
jgi:hypothetical protein